MTQSDFIPLFLLEGSCLVIITLLCNRRSTRTEEEELLLRARIERGAYSNAVRVKERKGEEALDSFRGGRTRRVDCEQFSTETVPHWKTAPFLFLFWKHFGRYHKYLVTYSESFLLSYRSFWYRDALSSDTIFRKRRGRLFQFSWQKHTWLFSKHAKVFRWWNDLRHQDENTCTLSLSRGARSKIVMFERSCHYMQQAMASVFYCFLTWKHIS